MKSGGLMDYEDPRLSKSGANVENTISNLEDEAKRLNSIRRTNVVYSRLDETIVSEQSSGCIELSDRCSRDERMTLLLTHSPSIVMPPHVCPLRIRDLRADETSLLDILLRVHSVYLRNTRRIMYRRLRLG